MPGAPLIYYGDENGMVGENDPDCRRTMGWEPEVWNQGISAPLKKLTELRQASTALRRGNIELAFSNDRIACYYRTWEEQRELIVLNNSRVAREICIPVKFSEGATIRDSLCGDTFPVVSGEIRFKPMSPRRAWVLQQVR